MKLGLIAIGYLIISYADWSAIFQRWYRIVTQPVDGYYSVLSRGKLLKTTYKSKMFKFMEQAVS